MKNNYLRARADAVVVRGALLAALIGGLSASPADLADEPAMVPESAAPITIKTGAEVERKTVVNGRMVVQLMPANRVVTGDLVIYTLEVRNAGAAPLRAAEFTSPIPEHMTYVEDSAVGPGAEVSYSVDGGRSFDKPQNLVARDADGKERRAVPADYTHIHWVLRHSLKPNSVAYIRFRAVLN